MSGVVDKLKIIDRNQNIFDLDGEYMIPLYQRAFAWEEKQLEQLIDDINDIRDEDNYYIGALVVARNGNRFEVVDGQQRLTSLYLLISCLGKRLKCSLSFACRDKSNYTLRKIHTKNTDTAIQFMEELKKEFPGFDIIYNPLSLSVACHIGPGALAVACCKKIK